MELQEWAVWFAASVIFGGGSVFVPYLRRVSEWLTTHMHELAHGVSALPFGGGMKGFKIQIDGSGHADVNYMMNPLTFLPARLLSLHAGYSTPPWVGFSIVLLILTGNLQPLLWVFGLLAVFSLLFARNWLAFLISVLYAGLFVLSLTFPSSSLQILGFLAGIYFVKGLKDIHLASTQVFSRTFDGKTDFHLMRDTVPLPAEAHYVWFLLNHVAIICGVVFLSVQNDWLGAVQASFRAVEEFSK